MSTGADLDRWLAGDATAGARVAAALRDPRAAADALHGLMLHELLRERLRARRRRRRALLLSAAALAACVALAALPLLRASAPTLDAAGGGTVALRDGHPVSGPLRPGDRIGGPAPRLALDDGSELELAPGSAAVVAALDRSAVVLALEAGSVSVRAARQPAGRELRITTPEATVRVVGTRFSVQRWPGGSAVGVDEGRVRVDPADGAPGRLLLPGDAWTLGLPRPLVRLDGDTAFDGAAWRDLGALPATTDGITILVQARAELNGQGARVLGLGDGPWQNNVSLMQWDRSLVLQVKQPQRPGGAVAEEQLEASDAVLPGRWAVYEATVAADGSARIVRDGTVLAAGRLPPPLAVPRAHAWVARSFYDNPLWRGAIRDLRVYPRALSPAEATAALAGFARP